MCIAQVRVCDEKGFAACVTEMFQCHCSTEVSGHYGKSLKDCFTICFGIFLFVCFCFGVFFDGGREVAWVCMF